MLKERDIGPDLSGTPTNKSRRIRDALATHFIIEPGIAYTEIEPSETSVSRMRKLHIPGFLRGR